MGLSPLGEDPTAPSILHAGAMGILHAGATGESDIAPQPRTTSRVRSGEDSEGADPHPVGEDRDGALDPSR
jgi:hypothetical protein